MDRNELGERSTVNQLKTVLGKRNKSAMSFIYKDLGRTWVRAEESGRVLYLSVMERYQHLCKISVLIY